MEDEEEAETRRELEPKAKEGKKGEKRLKQKLKLEINKDYSVTLSGFQSRTKTTLPALIIATSSTKRRRKTEPEKKETKKRNDKFCNNGKPPPP